MPIMVHIPPVTNEMADAGFQAVRRLADQAGEGWALSMVADKQVLDAVVYIYQCMRAHEPLPPVAPPVVPPVPQGSSNVKG